MTVEQKERYKDWRKWYCLVDHIEGVESPVKIVILKKGIIPSAKTVPGYQGLQHEISSKPLGKDWKRYTTHPEEGYMIDE